MGLHSDLPDNSSPEVSPLAPTEGSLAYSTLLLNEKDVRGSHKMLGKLLIALALRAEARGLFLQTSRGPAT